MNVPKSYISAQARPLVRDAPHAGREWAVSTAGVAALGLSASRVSAALDGFPPARYRPGLDECATHPRRAAVPVAPPLGGRKGIEAGGQPRALPGWPYEALCA